MDIIKCYTALRRFPRFFHGSPHNRIAKKMPNPWDLMTGKERWEALQYIKGNVDPFSVGPHKQGPGTKDCPNVVPSFAEKRMVYCLCKNGLVRFWLHECFPRRCLCNNWFILERLPVPKIYEDCPDE